ncbi:MAG: DUF7662 domain-containing protein [Candidatus Hodarchaeales archaeon]
MRKYEPLGVYLRNIEDRRCILTRTQIEEIINSKLPSSSSIHRQRWENNDSHVQAKDGWLEAGWMVESVNEDYSRIVFSR